MLAGIDVGSNTVRLILGQVSRDGVKPVRYVRYVTRLAGNFDSRQGLAPQRMENTLVALHDMARIIDAAGVKQVRVAGTEALRRACNADEFVNLVRERTGLSLQIIDGEEEARLSCAGMCAALDPPSERCLMFDIGGGSTEFILCIEGRVLFQKSYPLGVVDLSERFAQVDQQQAQIHAVLESVIDDLKRYDVFDDALNQETLLVGTAGTATTLAAVKLRMNTYDGLRVNNQILYEDELHSLLQSLVPMTVTQREQIPGLETGRGDLILPGLRIVLGIFHRFARRSMKVSDFGLLEGLLLQMGDSSGFQDD